MSALERRTITPLGWPTAGTLVQDRDGSRVPIYCGAGEALWVTDEAWGRQLITALTAAVNALEAVNQREAMGSPADDDEPAAEDPGPRTDDTVVIDRVGADGPDDERPTGDQPTAAKETADGVPAELAPVAT